MMSRLDSLANVHKLYASNMVTIYTLCISWGILRDGCELNGNSVRITVHTYNRMRQRVRGFREFVTEN